MTKTRGFLMLVVAACGGSSSSGDDTPPDASARCVPVAGAAAETVMTTSGLVHGAVANETFAYKRVPFAAPPMGELRYAPPQPPACASGEIDATALGPVCPQLDNGAFVGDEDCLHLNIWTPSAPAGAPRPVMVWIHGGGNSIGSAVYPIYDGRRLAEVGDAIVVTTNYRLGQLGFLALGGDGAGVYGMLDQIAALQWVRDNIAAFGGDPSNVTIFGESAGARDVCSLVASPAAKGLFHRAIMESGSCKALPTRTAAEQTAAQVATTVGCAAGDVACFRALPAETIIRANASDISGLSSGAYQPMIDGVVQTDQPDNVIAAGAHSHVPFVVGANADETGNSAPAIMTEAQYDALVHSQLPMAIADMALQQYPASAYPTPRAAYVRLTTDARFVCPAREIARAADAGQSDAVYRYFFQYRASPLGAVHGLDVPYVFGTFDGIETPNGNPYTPTATDLALSASIQGYWTRFARTGDPGGTPAWPLYGAADPTLVFDATVSTTDGIRTAHCDFWQPFYDAI
ncbi:MAG TPA: carboxylesterase family protein [Kofleriaceae bacterium]|nr:carboxylesterase family protein [Kofleriaceae bacterium]